MTADELDLGACFDVAAGGVVLRVHAQPGARHSGIAGRHGDALKVKVAASPVEGRANAELITLIAALAGVAPSAVTLAGGATSRAKRFKILGVTAPEMTARLAFALDPSVRAP